MRPKVASGGEVEEEVNVALGLGGAAGVGADEGESAHALGREVARLGRQDALELCHEVGIGRRGHGASPYHGSLAALCHEIATGARPKAPSPKFGGGAGELSSPAICPSFPHSGVAGKERGARGRPWSGIGEGGQAAAARRTFSSFLVASDSSTESIAATSRARRSRAARYICRSL